jgi:hypothetical protein
MLIQFVLSLTFATFASLDQIEVLIDENRISQKIVKFYGFKQMTQLKIKCCKIGRTIFQIVHNTLITNRLYSKKVDKPKQYSSKRPTKNQHPLARAYVR